MQLMYCTALHSSTHAGDERNQRNRSSLRANRDGARSEWSLLGPWGDGSAVERCATRPRRVVCEARLGTEIARARALGCTWVVTVRADLVDVSCAPPHGIGLERVQAPSKSPWANEIAELGSGSKQPTPRRPLLLFPPLPSSAFGLLTGCLGVNFRWAHRHRLHLAQYGKGPDGGSRS